MIATRRGKDAEIVYRTRCIPASSRSGWYPQVRIMIRVGIREASKKM